MSILLKQNVATNASFDVTMHSAAASCSNSQLSSNVDMKQYINSNNFADTESYRSNDTENIALHVQNSALLNSSTVHGDHNFSESSVVTKPTDKIVELLGRQLTPPEVTLFNFIKSLLERQREKEAAEWKEFCENISNTSDRHFDKPHEAVDTTFVKHSFSLASHDDTQMVQSEKLEQSLDKQLEQNIVKRAEQREEPSENKRKEERKQFRQSLISEITNSNNAQMKQLEQKIEHTNSLINQPEHNLDEKDEARMKQFEQSLDKKSNDFHQSLVSEITQQFEEQWKQLEHNTYKNFDKRCKQFERNIETKIQSFDTHSEDDTQTDFQQLSQLEICNSECNLSQSFETDSETSSDSDDEDNSSQCWEAYYEISIDSDEVDSIQTDSQQFLQTDVDNSGTICTARNEQLQFDNTKHEVNCILDNSNDVNDFSEISENSDHSDDNSITTHALTNKQFDNTCNETLVSDAFCYENNSNTQNEHTFQQPFTESNTQPEIFTDNSSSSRQNFIDSQKNITQTFQQDFNNKVSDDVSSVYNDNASHSGFLPNAKRNSQSDHVRQLNAPPSTVMPRPPVTYSAYQLLVPPINNAKVANSASAAPKQTLTDQLMHAHSAISNVYTPLPGNTVQAPIDVLARSQNTSVTSRNKQLLDYSFIYTDMMYYKFLNISEKLNETGSEYLSDSLTCDLQFCHFTNTTAAFDTTSHRNSVIKKHFAYKRILLENYWKKVRFKNDRFLTDSVN